MESKKKKNDRNELIYKTETSSDLENKLMVTKGQRWGGEDKLGVWVWYIHTPIFKVDNQQGPTV